MTPRWNTQTAAPSSPRARKFSSNSSRTASQPGATHPLTSSMPWVVFTLSFIRRMSMGPRSFQNQRLSSLRWMQMSTPYAQATAASHAASSSHPHAPLPHGGAPVSWAPIMAPITVKKRIVDSGSCRQPVPGAAPGPSRHVLQPFVSTTHTKLKPRKSKAAMARMMKSVPCMLLRSTPLGCGMVSLASTRSSSSETRNGSVFQRQFFAFLRVLFRQRLARFVHNSTKPFRTSRPPDPVIVDQLQCHYPKSGAQVELERPPSAEQAFI